MRKRPVLGVAVALVILAACAPNPQGPSAPLAREQFGEAPGLDAAAARQTVVDFVDAYAASPTAGVLPLAHLVIGPDMASWVRWLAVQHREFPGSITGSADVRDVEFVGALEGQAATGAQIGLSATVTFSYAPTGADPFERSRILDGPVTLVRTAAGTFRVVDLVRDGVPMSDGIQIFKHEGQTDGGVTVTLDSVFTFAPNWQFNVVVANRSGRTLVADPRASGLFVTAHGTTEGSPSAVTPSLETIASGRPVDGIFAVPLQDDASGRTLSLVFHDGRRLLRFEFPLEDLVETAPAGATGPTAATGPSASGSTGSTL
jgi:hypothetical protein